MSAAGGKFFNQVFIGIANHVQPADTTGLEVKFGFGEVFQQHSEHNIFLLFFAKFVGVERNILEHAVAAVFEFAAVGFFDGVQCLVDALTVARLVSVVIQGVKIGALRQYKTLVFHHFGNQFWLVAVLLLIIFIVILPHIGDVFQKQHGQDEIFISVRANRAAKGVAGRPHSVVDAVLVDVVGWGLAGHDWLSLIKC